VTSRIYYTDPSCRRFEAVVIRTLQHDGRPAAVLDRTAFYPTSGGQPFDVGSLAERHGCSSATVRVVDTIDADDEIVHVLSGPIATGVAVAGEVEWTRRFDGRPGPIGLFGHAFLAIDVMTAFTSMITLGIFEKYHRMKCAVLEAGATWIASWLDRLDYKSEVTEAFSPIKLKPSEYFYRQCVVSADPDETMIAPVVKHLGADYFIWASDYPHIDASFGVVKEMKERVASLPLADQRKVLGQNAVRFYNL